jgi:RNA polymerase-binding transcription factor DksA
MTEEQRQYLENRLLDERADRMRRLALFQEEESGSSERDRSGDLTAAPFHLADLGTDTMQQEMDAAEATRGSRELEEIDAALERLHREPTRFGLDERTGREIPFARLDAVPWARTAVDDPGTAG